MKVLLDHCVPKRFRRLLSGHQVRTVYEMGWAALRNGRLLAEARQAFDVFITVDQGIQFQQNLSSLPLPVIVLAASDTRFETLAPYAPTVLDALHRLKERQLLRITAPGHMEVVRQPPRHPKP